MGRATNSDRRSTSRAGGLAKYVAMKATSVNPIDIFTGGNAGYEQSMKLPFVPG